MQIPTGVGPGQAHLGALRYNDITGRLEVYMGNHWIATPGQHNPKTWREWLEYFASEFIDHGGLDHKLLYIQRKMHDRFPGPYVIKHLGDGEFDLDFYTSADATWWHLKYD